jgi:hypothetical protein
VEIAKPSLPTQKFINRHLGGGDEKLIETEMAVFPVSVSQFSQQKGPTA